MQIHLSKGVGDQHPCACPQRSAILGTRNGAKRSDAGERVNETAESQEPVAIIYLSFPNAFDVDIEKPSQEAIKETC